MTPLIVPESRLPAKIKPFSHKIAKDRQVRSLDSPIQAWSALALKRLERRFPDRRFL